MIRRLPAVLLLLAAGLPARAEPVRLVQAAPAEAGRSSAEGGRPSAFSGLSGGAKEPIKIDADRLDVFDKEQRAVFAGNVVAVQGDSTMRCTSLTVLYEQGKGTGANPAAQAPGAPVGGSTPGGGDIRKIDCKGPVTVTAKTQTATSDNATFDRVQNKIFLTGNAALSDGPNVTRGDRVVYDLNASRAYVEGRVRALIVPGGGGTLPGGAATPERKAATPPPRAATN